MFHLLSDMARITELTQQLLDDCDRIHIIDYNLINKIILSPIKCQKDYQ